MKQQKSFIKNQNCVSLQRKKAVIILLTFCIVSFASGYIISSNVLLKPINNSLFEFYEQVARDVYEQQDKAIVYVPVGVSFEGADTSFTISSADKNFRGKVIANSQNDELVLTRDTEMGKAIFLNSLFGVGFTAQILVLMGAISFFYLRKRQKI